MLDKLLSNTYFLIFVLLISASLGWLFDLKNKHYTKLINPTSVLALDTVIGFIFFILIYFITNKNKYIISDISKLNYKDISYFFILALLSTFVSFIWIDFLRIHNIKKIRSFDYLIDIMITIVAFTFIMKREFTWKKIIGLPIIIIGMYLINT
jgi:drug/metabolite transporter (DMT)-like permease